MREKNPPPMKFGRARGSGIKGKTVASDGHGESTSIRARAMKRAGIATIARVRAQSRATRLNNDENAGNK